MHRLSSKSAVTRFRVAALLLCAICLLVFASFGVLAYSLVVGDDELTLLGLGLGGAAVFAVVMQWILSARAKCPLCLTPVLAGKACAKHRRAQKFLGSYRLRVALGVLFRGKFTCPYCSERTAVEVRPNRRGDSRG